MRGDLIDDHRYHRRLQEHRYGAGRSEYGPSRPEAFAAATPLIPSAIAGATTAVLRDRRARCRRRRLAPVARDVQRVARQGAAWAAAVGLCPALILHDLQAHPHLRGTAIRARLPRPENLDRWLAARFDRWAALARRA